MQAVLKYVVIEEQGCEVPIAFPDLIQHDTFIDLKPISAGFVSFVDNGFEGAVLINCYGESTSLRLKSRGKVDTELMIQLFGIEGD